MSDTDRLAALLIEVFPAANRNQWPFTATDVAAALIAAGVTLAPTPPGLDAAWAEAEAALPEGWHLDRLNRNGPKDWTAYASEAPYLGLEMGAANTPAAALRALMDALRQAVPSAPRWRPSDD